MVQISTQNLKQTPISLCPSNPAFSIYAAILLWQESRNVPHDEIGGQCQLLFRWLIIAIWQGKWLAYSHSDLGSANNETKTTDILATTDTDWKERGSGAESDKGDPSITLLHLSIWAPCTLREHPQDLPAIKYC